LSYGAQLEFDLSQAVCESKVLKDYCTRSEVEGLALGGGMSKPRTTTIQPKPKSPQEIPKTIGSAPRSSAPAKLSERLGRDPEAHREAVELLNNHLKALAKTGQHVPAHDPRAAMAWKGKVEPETAGQALGRLRETITRLVNQSLPESRQQRTWEVKRQFLTVTIRYSANESYGIAMWPTVEREWSADMAKVLEVKGSVVARSNRGIKVDMTELAFERLGGHFQAAQVLEHAMKPAQEGDVTLGGGVVLYGNAAYVFYKSGLNNIAGVSSGREPDRGMGKEDRAIFATVLGHALDMNLYDGKTGQPL
jgi:hypothetical protein